MSGIDDETKCDHGKTHGERRREGCNGCDEDRAKERAAEIAEEERRERVIETARALLAARIACPREIEDLQATFDWLFVVAEKFDEQADYYRVDGK